MINFIQNRQKLQKSEHLLSSLYSDMSPCIRAFASPTVALLEIVPHLLTIMTPNIRAVGGAIMSIDIEKMLGSNMYGKT